MSSVYKRELDIRLKVKQLIKDTTRPEKSNYIEVNTKNK